MITDHLLPVNDGTNLTLSCSADYVNLENTTSTAECRNGTVVATRKLPNCVGTFEIKSSVNFVKVCRIF